MIAARPRNALTPPAGPAPHAHPLHTPVLVAPVLDMLAPRPNGRYLDGTLGMGGHAEALLAAAPGIEVCGLDRDPQALEHARERLAPLGGRVHLFHKTYSEFAVALCELGWSGADVRPDQVLDGALLDIGVSSLQLDDAARGFSLHGIGPLDMRMDQGSALPSAWQLVNRAPYATLRGHIATLGEDPQAGRIARAIVDARQKRSIDTTEELADIVWRAYPPAWRARARNHPATRTFQALRMVVNDELGQLRAFLDAILPALRLGGRLAIITFHSLEDRMVKQAMRHWAEGCRCPQTVMRCQCRHVPEVRILTRKPLVADAAECRANPRASCAKLRACERVSTGVAA